MMHTLLSLLLSLWAPAYFILNVYAQGNTACVGSDLDWYKNSVGETPCQTYQRLRQICNSAYTVGTLSVNTPPDTCDDQVADCCCNSVSFALSMLCLNCQQDKNSAIGIDAGVGAYQIYLSHVPSWCPKTNQSLPGNVQTAVCNENIKILDTLYNLFWSDGSWYYTFTRERAEEDFASNGSKDFSHCASSPGTTTKAATTSTATTSHSQSSTQNTSSTANSSKSTSSTSSPSGPPAYSATVGETSISPLPSTSLSNTASHTSSNLGFSKGAIAGLAAGVAVILVIFVIIAFMYRNRQRTRRPQTLDTFAPYSVVSSPPDSNVAFHGSSEFQAARFSVPTSTSASGHSAPSTDLYPGSDHLSMSQRREVDAGPLPSARLPPAYRSGDWTQRPSLID